MGSWARRMHRRVAAFGNIVASCGNGPFPRRLEKVKFGAPLAQVFRDNIPAQLLVLLLRLNKEGPARRDVFRAPGHQGAMRKLVHFLDHGRIVNLDHFSVFTIASTLKKFVRKVPGGVFGRSGEARLFASVNLPMEDQLAEIRELLASLPENTQRLLVLLFGTFRVIATIAEKTGTGMTAEALGVSVAPSFFHSCVEQGDLATMKDVARYKVATGLIRQMIEQFSAGCLFERENYVFYAKVTGRILRVNEEWICSFIDPPLPALKEEQEAFSKKYSFEDEQTWLQCEFNRLAKINNLKAMSKSEICQSTSALDMDPGEGPSGAALGISEEHSLLDSRTRLSTSLEESVFKASVGPSSPAASRNNSGPKMTEEELRAINKYAESTKSLTYLPQVHERQCARMRTRSEWFLQPAASLDAARARAAGAAGGELRNSGLKSWRNLCGGDGASGLNNAHSDNEIAFTHQPRQVTDLAQPSTSKHAATSF